MHGELVSQQENSHYNRGIGLSSCAGAASSGEMAATPHSGSRSGCHHPGSAGAAPV
jgi:hypothetical protein